MRIKTKIVKTTTRLYEAGDIVNVNTKGWTGFPQDSWAIVLRGNEEGQTSLEVVFFNSPFHKGCFELGADYKRCIVFTSQINDSAYTFNVPLADTRHFEYYLPPSREKEAESENNNAEGVANVKAIEALSISGFLLEFVDEKTGAWKPSEFEMFTEDTIDEHDGSYYLLHQAENDEFMDGEVYVGMLADLPPYVWCGHFGDWNDRLGISFHPEKGVFAGTAKCGMWRVQRRTVSGKLSASAKRFFLAHPAMQIHPVSETEYLK